MRLFLSTLLLLFSVTVYAQRPAAEYVDVVHRYGEDALVGTVLTYEYGKQVTIVTEDGTTHKLLWTEVKRVNFRQDKSTKSATQISANRREAAAAYRARQHLAAPSSPMPSPPARAYLHQLAVNTNFGSVTNVNFGLSGTAIGAGLAYHLLRPVGPVTLGVGLDLSLLSYEREENAVALTALVEYSPLKGRRLRPLLRMEGGPSYPIGGTLAGGELSERIISPMFHPAVGVQIMPREDQWGHLFFDLGYRFLDTRFTLTTIDLDVIERRVAYRRLVVRGGFRF